MDWNAARETVINDKSQKVSPRKNNIKEKLKVQALNNTK